jgi:hypothetical protein
VHFEVICPEKYLSGEKLNSISVREIRHQRINNYLQPVLVRGKIAEPSPRQLFIPGLPTWRIFPLKNKFMDSFEKYPGPFVDHYLAF